MTDDERAIRELVDTWFTAMKAGDNATFLGLMIDDVIFMAAGQEPFGKEAFEAAAKRSEDVVVDGRVDIREINIMGSWAYTRSFIRIEASTPGSEPVHRSGYALSVLRKESDGKWRVARDANLLTADN